MSTASIVVAALAHADVDSQQLMAVLVSSRQFYNAGAPRWSTARALDSPMFAICSQAPTSCWTADLSVDRPSRKVLQIMSVAFPYLRQLVVAGPFDDVEGDVGTMLSALASASTATQRHASHLRDIEMGGTFLISDLTIAGLRDHAPHLESLALGQCWIVTNDGLASLRGLRRLLRLNLACMELVTDAAVSAVLADSTWLQTLAVAECTLLTGAFLQTLVGVCGDTLREVSVTACPEFNSDGAAHLCAFDRLRMLTVTGCSALTEMPLERISAFRDHVTVAPLFFSENGALMTLDLSALAHVTAIDDGFCSNCRGLTDLDLSPFRRVTTVGRWFLSSCSGLQRIDLSPLCNVASVSMAFMFECSGLQTLDLTSWRVVEFVDIYFLHGTASLLQLRLSDALLALASVRDFRLK